MPTRILRALCLLSAFCTLSIPGFAEVSAPSSQARFVTPDPATLSPEMRQVYDNSVKLLGGPYGPRIPMLQSPAVADEWAKLLDALAATSLAKRHWELGILAVARTRNSPFEWWAHANNAAKLGIPQDEIEALRIGKVPAFRDTGDAVVYRYATALLVDKPVPDRVFNDAKAVLGDKDLLNLTVLIGYYDTVAMVLKTYDMDVPPKSSTLPALVIKR